VPRRAGSLSVTSVGTHVARWVDATEMRIAVAATARTLAA
jgi:hypothetical protein